MGILPLVSYFGNLLIRITINQFKSMSQASTLRKLETRLRRKKAREEKKRAKVAMKNKIATLRKQLAK